MTSGYSLLIIYAVGFALTMALMRRPGTEKIDKELNRKGVRDVIPFLLMIALIWPVVLPYKIFMLLHEYFDTDYYRRYRKWEKDVHFDLD